jgi:hypothetical protein
MENYKVPSILQNPLLLNTAINGLKQFAFFNNVTVLDAQENNYVINAGTAPDVPSSQFISKLGTVVYSNLIFNAGKIIEGSDVVDQWEDFRIDDALFVVNQSKKIITTEIQGKDGTIKEYVGMDDFQIQITGRISGDYNVYEKDKVKTLKRILSAGQPLAITSWYLQNLDITDVVIKDFNFPQSEGEYSTQYFTIMAMSDNPIFADLITNQ